MGIKYELLSKLKLWFALKGRMKKIWQQIFACRLNTKYVESRRAVNLRTSDQILYTRALIFLVLENMCAKSGGGGGQCTPTSLL